MVQRQYYPNGLLKEEQQDVLGEHHVLNYTYDRANRQTQVTYPDGSVVVRTFTDRDQLKTVSLNGSLIASRDEYSIGMRLRLARLGNGLVERRDYSPRRVCCALLEVPGVTTFSYSYDANKWKQEERVTTAPDESQSFLRADGTSGYDAEGRLESWARGSAQTQTWTLSPVGDWKQTQRNGAVEDSHA